MAGFVLSVPFVSRASTYGAGLYGAGVYNNSNTAPVVSAFVIPSTASALEVSITTFTATDDVSVTGYKITESSTAPLAGDAGWTASAPSTYTFSSAGVKTLYAWAKDAGGLISTSLNDAVTITLPAAAQTSSPSATNSSGSRRRCVNCWITAGDVPPLVSSTSISSITESADQIDLPGTKDDLESWVQSNSFVRDLGDTEENITETRSASSTEDSNNSTKQSIALDTSDNASAFAKKIWGAFRKLLSNIWGIFR